MDEKEKKEVGKAKDEKRTLALVLLSALAIASIVYALYTLTLAFLSLSGEEKPVDIIGDMTTKEEEESSDNSANEIAQRVSFVYNAEDATIGLTWLDME